MKLFLCTSLLLAAAAGLLSAGWRGDRPEKVTKADVERWVKELSNWGRWGPGDELGTLHLITPEKRVKAAGMVKIGVSVSLAHNDSTEKTPDNNPPFGHEMLTTGLDRSAPFAMDRYTETYHGFGITHLDALCHMFYGNSLYNGYSRQSVTSTGAGKLDVLQLKEGIFTRAILFDIPRLKGRPYLDPDEAIYPKDLDAWEEKVGVKAERGDVVLIRTGRWTRRQKLGPWDIGKHSAGLDASCARWLHARDIAVLGSDAASDVLPSGVDGVSMPIHLLTLFSMGTPILDNCDLEHLSEVAESQHRWVFLLTVAPEPVPGGTGSPINPTAVF